MNGKRTLVISSELENIEPVISELTKRAMEIGFSDDKIWSLTLALREALSNAIIHGNKEDKEKKVEIVYEIGEADLQIKIKDEGEGFDFRQIPDPLEEKNMASPSGRGIFLLKNCIDKVFFNTKGNEIIIAQKKI